MRRTRHGDPISRRTFLRSAAVGGAGLAGAYLIGCGGGDGGAGATATLVPPEPTLGPTSTPGPTAFRWTQLIAQGDDLPGPRRDHTVVNDGTHLYVFGGRDPDPLADTWLYDIVSNQWGLVPAGLGPPPRFGHNAIWDERTLRMIVFGGQNDDGFLDDVWALAPALLAWEQLSVGDLMPAARYGAGGARNNAGELMITHGFTNDGRFDDTWSYNLFDAAWSDVSPETGRPVERCLVQAVWDGDKNRLLMFGGQTTGTAHLGDFWALKDGVWSELPSGPSPRNLYTMAWDPRGDILFLHGGSTPDGPADDVWCFDSSERWTQLEIEGERPSPRSSHDGSWVTAASSLYVFGGNDGNDNLGDLWQLHEAPA